MSQTNMKRALNQQLLNIIGIPVLVPNDTKKAPNNSPYAELTHFLAPPVVFTLGTDGLDEHRGVMQVLLKYPEGKGSGDLDEKADAIREGFRAGLKLNYDGQEVMVVNSGAGNYSNLDNKFVCPISITWYAFSRR
jgi:hypothetical protein